MGAISAVDCACSLPWSAGLVDGFSLFVKTVRSGATRPVELVLSQIAALCGGWRYGGVGWRSSCWVIWSPSLVMCEEGVDVGGSCSDAGVAAGGVLCAGWRVHEAARPPSRDGVLVSWACNWSGSQPPSRRPSLASGARRASGERVLVGVLPGLFFSRLPLPYSM